MPARLADVIVLLLLLLIDCLLYCEISECCCWLLQDVHVLLFLVDVVVSCLKVMFFRFAVVLFLFLIWFVILIFVVQAMNVCNLN